MQSYCQTRRTGLCLCLVFMWVMTGSVKAGPGDVVINEIAWMGTLASGNHEWIELYNNTSQSINLKDWVLEASDGSPSIVLEGEIGPLAFYLLERTSDNTIADMAADFIYTGVLSNAGEYLLLKDADGNVVDEVNCSQGWHGGDNDSKASMERLHPRIDGSAAGSWGTNDGITRNGTDAGGSPINGTPGRMNSNYDISLSVRLTDFRVIPVVSGLSVQWKTESEHGTAGYYILRANTKEGPYQRVHQTLIPAKGRAASYELIDENVVHETVYWYLLQELDQEGNTHDFGPVHGIMRLKTSAETFFCGNFPNPFNPSTTIRYRVPELFSPSRMAVRIYDILGRELVTLVNRVHEPGEYQVIWDGRNAGGLPMASGRYISILYHEDRPLAQIAMIKCK